MTFLQVLLHFSDIRNVTKIIKNQIITFASAGKPSFMIALNLMIIIKSDGAKVAFQKIDPIGTDIERCLAQHARCLQTGVFRNLCFLF